MPRFFATVAKGIEPITAEELKGLGAPTVEPSFGGVHFEGDLELLYRVNLWARTPTRVLMPLREFAAKTPSMLYDQVRRIKWEHYLNPEKTFCVDCTIAGAKKLSSVGDAGRQGLTHSRYAALKIKDAIVDQLRLKQGARPNVDTLNPDLRLVAYLNGGRCTLSLDASGTSLHERGYRQQGAGAPLKETLAAAIIELSGWKISTPFIDPMCGSGTLPLEAAMKALDIAPGLFRERFAFFGWPDFDEPLWLRVVEEARGRARHKLAAPIVGYDQARESIASAIDNARRAGLARLVHFERRTIDTLAPIGQEPGTLIVNPPYGERLGEVEELKGLYKLLGDLFKQRMKGWTACVFTGNRELAKHIGLHTSRRIELYNGPIECRLLKYELY